MDNLRAHWIIVARWFTAPERVTGWEIIQWIRAAFNGSDTLLKYKYFFEKKHEIR